MAGAMKRLTLSSIAAFTYGADGDFSFEISFFIIFSNGTVSSTSKLTFITPSFSARFTAKILCGTIVLTSS